MRDIKIDENMELLIESSKLIEVLSILYAKDQYEEETVDEAFRLASKNNGVLYWIAAVQRKIAYRILQILRTTE